MRLKYTFAFGIGRAPGSSLMSTVSVLISAESALSKFRSGCKKPTKREGIQVGEASLFSTANPLFFRISATVTTVEIAAYIDRKYC